MTCRGIAIAVFDLLLVLGVLGGLTPTVHAQPPSLNVHFWPGFLTPNDHLLIDANVTRTVPLENVTIFYRIGPSELHLSSKSDYSRTLMLNVTQKAGWELWEYQFMKQPVNTTIYFFVEASDLTGEVSSWPGNIPEAATPMALPVKNPDASYLGSLLITINNLDLGAKAQRANITLALGGFIPHFQYEDFVQTTVLSGPYFVFYVPLLEGSQRFYYYGQASAWISLINGRIEAAPFDAYDLFLTIMFPYPIMNITRSIDSVPIYFATYDLWNAWNIRSAAPIWSQETNSTRLAIHATLARNGVTGFVPTYPPLVLLFTSLGILGLAPLIAKYHRDKQWDVYLNAIILAASAELSQNIFLVGGVLQQNFFTYFFAYVLGFSLVLMAVSGLSPAIGKLPRQIPLESYATVLMSIVVASTIYNWSIPDTAKILSVLLVIFGVIILGSIAGIRRVAVHWPYVRVRKLLMEVIQGQKNSESE